MIKTHFYRTYYIGQNEPAPDLHRELSDRLWKSLYGMPKTPEVHAFASQLFGETWNMLSRIESAELEWTTKNELGKKVLIYFEESLVDAKNNVELLIVLCSNLKVWLNYLFSSSVSA
jgi:hypothetical protein